MSMFSCKRSSAIACKYASSTSLIMLQSSLSPLPPTWVLLSNTVLSTQSMPILTFTDLPIMTKVVKRVMLLHNGLFLVLKGLEPRGGKAHFRRPKDSMLVSTSNSSITHVEWDFERLHHPCPRTSGNKTYTKRKSTQVARRRSSTLCRCLSEWN